MTEPKTPRRSRRAELEESIEDYLERRVTEVGGETRKLVWDGRRSAPDRMVLLPASKPGGFRYMGEQHPVVELKKPGGKAKFPANERERAQAREHERLRAAGFLVYVIDSKEDIEDILR